MLLLGGGGYRSGSGGCELGVGFVLLVVVRGIGLRVVIGGPPGWTFLGSFFFFFFFFFFSFLVVVVFLFLARL